MAFSGIKAPKTIPRVVVFIAPLGISGIFNFEIVLGDVRDYDSVYKVMKKCKSVMHLAALIGIPYSYESPSAYIKTNIEGTYNVLESARMNNF